LLLCLLLLLLLLSGKPLVLTPSLLCLDFCQAQLEAFEGMEGALQRGKATNNGGRNAASESFVNSCNLWCIQIALTLYSKCDCRLLATFQHAVAAP
jgi:hypothetical protein